MSKMTIVTQSNCHTLAWMFNFGTIFVEIMFETISGHGKIENLNK